MLPDLLPEEIQRYARQIVIPEVGSEGQRKIKNASVLLIGAGGLGSAIALYLAAAGVGRIGIIDADRVEITNLQRQVMYGVSQLDQLKVVSAKQRLLDVNPLIHIEPYPERFTAENALQVVAPYDILMDGTDNFTSRYLINDISIQTGKPYIYGSVFRFEGQVSVFDPHVGPCYRCVFPEPPPPETEIPNAQAGVMGILPGTIGTIQAAEAIKIILGIQPSLSGWLLLYDALEMEFQKVHLRKNPDCKSCGRLIGAPHSPKDARH